MDLKQTAFIQAMMKETRDKAFEEMAERLHSAVSNRGAADIHTIINDVMNHLKGDAK